MKEISNCEINVKQTNNTDWLVHLFTTAMILRIALINSCFLWTHIHKCRQIF